MNTRKVVKTIDISKKFMLNTGNLSNWHARHTPSYRPNSWLLLRDKIVRPGLFVYICRNKQRQKVQWNQENGS
ncbi:hypothetical protein ACQKIC_03270 [Peribacillus sp. NPDC046944]|uniref:hypothetical protein n=1 Tax=unclassified Peribacillus TaxID=2675266 RepID=UPI0038903195